MNAVVARRLVAAGLILAFALISPASLLFVPFAAAMVYADLILIRWSAKANRAYSIREMLIVEGVAVAGLCLLLWLLRRFVPSAGLFTAFAPVAAVTAFRVGSGYLAGRTKVSRK